MSEVCGSFPNGARVPHDEMMGGWADFGGGAVDSLRYVDHSGL